MDPATGRVWWPWDGGSGHWVDPSEAPGLIAQWDRELESETARRIDRHDAQREQDWQDLHDRIRRSEAEEAARRAAEQARLDAFDRRVAAARTWMEEADAGSLDQLDRIVAQAANQGFVTDEDLAQAAGIADRARVWADTRRQWDAEDWIRITANRNAVLGVTAKGISMLIDPTKGLTSGFIWGVAESWDRGDDLATVVANGAFEAAVLRGGYAVATWGPGRAVLGNMGWGSLSGAATAAGETLLRGGTLEEAWEAGKAGFVLGGLGGVVEDAVASRPPPEVPLIRSRPGGRSHWDFPMDPRHIDELDPRFRPPGTPAEQVHVPPSSPWDWSQPPPRLDESGADGGPPADVPVIVNRPGGPTPYYDQPSDHTGLLPGDPRSPWDPAQPPQARPTPIEDVDIPVDPGDPRSSWGWSSQPPKPGDLPGWGPEVPDTPPVRPPPTPGPVAPERPIPGPSPAAPEDLLAGARPSRPSGDVLDDMMRQPRQPAAAEPPSGGRVPDWQRGFFPDAEGRTMIDTDGRVVVGDRQIGSVDPETGTLRNLGGEPMTVALDHRGVPVGYLEQPDVPPGMRPAYSEHGTLAGYVDERGRADLGGGRVPVAMDADGRLVPYEAPAAQSGDGLDDLRLASQGRVPVLDERGAVDHFVEPGPREIHYRDGVPHYVQRQYPVRGTSMQDIVIDRSRPPTELQRMPTPEVYDLTQVSCPLVGEGAPPPAPQVGPPNPQGGER